MKVIYINSDSNYYNVEFEGISSPISMAKEVTVILNRLGESVSPEKGNIMDLYIKLISDPYIRIKRIAEHSNFVSGMNIKKIYLVRR